MPPLVEADVSFDTVTVPTPPVRIETRTIDFPDLPAIRLPDIDVAGGRLPLGTIRTPSHRLVLPDVRLSSDRVDLPSTPSIPVPDVDLPRLDVDYSTFSFLGGAVRFTVPTDVDLRGGRITYDFRGGRDLGSVRVPDVDVDRDVVQIGGDRIGLPTIDLPRFRQELPTVPGLELPPFDVPTGVTLLGTTSIIDPTSVRVVVGVNLPDLSRFVLQFLPESFVEDPVLWSFETAVSGFLRGIGAGSLTLLKNATEAVLQHALSSETKEELQSRGRE